MLTILLTISLAGCSLIARAKNVYESPSTHEELRINMIAEVEASVVAVLTETGHGSGIIYKSELVNPEDLEDKLTRYYILTNYHVVEDGGEMKVHFGLGQEDINVSDYQGYEPYDIAVVRIETTRVLRVHNVEPINENVITEIRKGQDVYVIGTPQDLDKFNHVTSGIVSLATYPYNNISGLGLMHESELNPGNSGGPLFNLKGELIGINVAKVTEIPTIDGTISAEGLNYALNINKIAPKIKTFREENYITIVRKPRLGVTIQEIETFLLDNDASLIPENTPGVVIVGFDSTRNADEVLNVYDLIIKIDGIQVTSIAELAAQLEDAEFGDIHQITVMRKVNDQFVPITEPITLS